MADVTTTFAAKDENFARTVDNLQKRLNGFEGGVNAFTGKVGSMAAAFGRVIGPLAALAAGFVGARAAVDSFRSAIDLGGKLNDLSARTGETAANLAVLQRAFQNAGMGAEAVGPMLNRLQKFMIAAGEGGKEQAEVMNKLGLSLSDLSSKAPLDQMRILAERIAAITDPAQRSALAMAVFGRSGGELLPLLRAMGVELDIARGQLGSYPAILQQNAEVMDRIGDNFGAMSSKAMEFATGLLAGSGALGALDKLTTALANMDSAGFGLKIGEQLKASFQSAYDFFQGLFAEPGRIFENYGLYLQAVFATAGDLLVTVFRVAIEGFVNFWRASVENDLFGKLADIVAKGLMWASMEFLHSMISKIEEVMSFFGQLWGSVTEQGIGHLAQRLFDVVVGFGQDLAKAFLDPFGITTMVSSLLGAAEDADKAFSFAFDSATGNFIANTKAGLRAAADDAREGMKEAGDAFGYAASQSLRAAFEQTDLSMSNLFGSKEAMQRLTDSFQATAEIGERIRSSQSEVPSYAESMLAAYEQAGLQATHLKNEIAAAKGEISVAGDFFTGPNGITTAAQQAAQATMNASSEITTAYENVATSGQQLAVSIKDAADQFVVKTNAASVQNGGNIMTNAMNTLTSALRGFATETTLQKAVACLERLERKLPQPVLV